MHLNILTKSIYFLKYFASNTNYTNDTNGVEDCQKCVYNSLMVAYTFENHDFEERGNHLPVNEGNEGTAKLQSYQSGTCQRKLLRRETMEVAVAEG